MPSSAIACRIKNSKSSTKSLEEFQERGTLLIATESAAEGVNLQFCSLVVNYDLPWNPQRIEQRIGRCHRYGQRHDVVVVNFLNDRNAADQRVFHLLAEKFRLFEGVFGASDEILGAVESGVDIERRIMEVYQTCRTPEAIAEAFDKLQADLEGQIDETMKATRRAILENFDEDVQKRLKGVKDEAERMLEGHQALLWRLATLVDAIEFVLRGTKGSLADFKSTTIKHLSTLGTPSSPLRVELEAGGKYWTGSLERSQPRLDGPDTRPRVKILRRSRLAKIVAATPAERFDELDRFVNVEGVVASEAGLERAAKEAKQRLENASREIADTELALQALWEESDRPAGNPVIGRKTSPRLRPRPPKEGGRTRSKVGSLELSGLLKTL